MRNLNHSRPQLRLLDNLRRELGKVPSGTGEPKPAENWPDYLRPIISRREAHIAFSELLGAVSDWTNDDEVISFSNPPQRLQKAAQVFANVRVEHPYDNQYRGRDWVAHLENSEKEEARAWGGLLSFFIGLRRSGE